MDLHAMLLEIEQHGLPLVMLIMLVVVWFVPWVKSMQQKFDRERAPTISENSELERTIISNMTINSVLESMRVELEAQWVVLWQFHNGEVSTAGVPFRKMSVTHEATAPDEYPRGAPYVNIPLSIFSEALTDIMKEDIITVTDETKYAPIVSIYRREGVARGYYVKVPDSRGHAIGVMSVTYKDIEKAKKITKDSLRKYANQLAITLGQLAMDHPPKRRKDD